MALDFQKINELISHNRISEAINLINDTLDSEPQNEAAWFWRGKLHWRMGNRRQAINDYTKAVDLNPHLVGDVLRIGHPPFLFHRQLHKGSGMEAAQ